MNKIRLAAAALALVLLAACTADTPPVQPVSAGRDIPVTESVTTRNESDLRLINALRAYIPNLLHAYGTPGLNIAVARRGEIVWEAGFGYSDVGAGKKMTPETVFNSGSMGKLYTGMAIMKLVEDGVIELDGPINDYLPFEVVNPLGGRPITVRDLLIHRPGLMSDAALSLFRKPRPLREEIEAEYEREMAAIAGGDAYPLWIAKPGDTFMYSNLGMGTLGVIVEENNPEGLSYSEYVERYLMQPLGMKFSQYPPIQDQEHIRPEIWERKSTGYMTMGSMFIPTPAVYFGEFTAGGFESTPGDFVRFFLAFLNEGEWNGARIMQPETVAEALSPQAEGMRGMQMGLSWMLNNVDEPGFSIQHGGAHMFGWHNWGIAWPNHDTAIVYATNHWPIPDIPPDVTMLRDFVEQWLTYDQIGDTIRGSGAEWSRKVSYARGVLFTAAFNHAIAIPTPVSDEQILAAADGAILNPDYAGTQDNWDQAAFIQGAKDLREHGFSTPAVQSFLDNNPVLTREEFVQAYRELGGNPEASAFFTPLLNGTPQ